MYKTFDKKKKNVNKKTNDLIIQNVVTKYVNANSSSRQLVTIVTYNI